MEDAARLRPASREAVPAAAPTPTGPRHVATPILRLLVVAQVPTAVALPLGATITPAAPRAGRVVPVGRLH